MAKKDFIKNFENDYAEREFSPKVTLQQLTHMMSSRNKFYSWGVSKKTNLYSKGLLLSVNANHHKGHVLITLAWNDTYTIRFFNKQYNEVFERQNDIYCDCLTNAIDSVIEWVPEYYDNTYFH